MKRKDCEIPEHTGARRIGSLPLPWLVSGVLFLVAPTTIVHAGTVRFWPSAAVVEDTIRLTDLCELSGFDLETEQALGDCTVADAPPPGGTRIIHLEMLRSVLAASGANMADITLRGAVRCKVSRASLSPSASPSEYSGTVIDRGTPDSGVRSRSVPREAALVPSSRSSRPTLLAASTLRQAVQDYFDAQFERYGGVAELIFDRASEQILNLSGPEYEFDVRRHKGSTLGLTSVEVHVVTGGKTVQTVPLVLQVAMRRNVVVARRAINQGAAIRESDLDLASMSFAHLDDVGLGELSRAVGQRAKRFIAVGSVIDGGMLEEVPLVQRGQLVTLASVVGGVRVVTTAKAAESGLLGEVIKVRAADNRRAEFDAVVVGPGSVEVSPGESARKDVQLAMGETR